ncbi:hypothetical protein P154DRAFT_294988 [Amniculicola lignicola CBS 123094]|uniref:Velvet domain-containing protein n=1 Tax=Amniculicola lignicola CBS 123094 TaxID=1392246 RepID=A0A6A5W5L6_9PLEO|nr:hypothetical protein P154DRAFT_294988 [Amniculicola lignicola CBS 123094]
MASIIQVSNETKSSASRVTKDGRKITYALQVIQQPERARACGSGAKSSADRRPVDPPPIVELRVYEGDTEITFSYNASFFLFATLENARAIAPGRAPSATPSFPVLTGTPVAGMAYLDRPSPAGYFIFPDLSVRHEGKYRLSFALYEELKDPKDMDPEDRSTLSTHPQTGIDAHVSHRLEVKSSPFVVFSAKKFPGLSESTALSRMVAEQGCRVRIRRDVRMRRRENKSSKEWDEYEEEGGYDQARRTATPDSYGQPGMPPANPALDDSNRPRSVSNASNASFAPPRRASMEDMNPGFQPANNYQQMPPPPNNGYPQMPQYNTSPNQYQNQFVAPQPAAPMMQPPQAPYAHQPQQTQASYQSQPAMHMGQPYGNYMPNQSYQQPHYEQSAPVRQEPPIEYAQPTTEYRRPSIPQPTQQYPGPNQMIPPFSPMDNQYNRTQQMNQQIQPLQTPNHNPPVSTPTSMRMPTGHSLAPLKTLQPPAPIDKIEPVSPLYQSPPNSMSAPMSATSETPQNQAYLDATRTKFAPQIQPQPQPTIGQKRSFSSTFDTKHMTDRLTQGARPNPGAPGYGYDGGYDEPDIEEPMDRAAMSYRRADGTHRQRRVPEIGV